MNVCVNSWLLKPVLEVVNTTMEMIEEKTEVCALKLLAHSVN